MKHEWKKMVRKTDPKTSKLAAKRHVKKALGRRNEQVLRLLRFYPGSTAGELGVLFGHAGAETPHKRLPELERMGKVRRGSKRPCGITNYLATTWYAKGHL